MTQEDEVWGALKRRVDNRNAARIDRVAIAINKKWNEIGDVPFPLYQREAEELAAAAIEAADAESE